MTPFLKEIIEKLGIEDTLEFEGMCFVFPTRRACGHFSRYLLRAYENKDFRLPDILSIRDFIEQESNLSIPDELKLLGDLYSVYRNAGDGTGNGEGFEEFLPWGKVLLADFDEVDKYMVDPSKLYRNIREIKEIEALFEIPQKRELLRRFWGTVHDDEDAVIKDFLNTWERIGNIYTEFRNLLREQGLGYEGMAYRQLVTESEKSAYQLPYKRIVFGGFNALSTSEERIFKSFLKRFRTDIFWDLDEYYLEDNVQEAGQFMRRYKEEFYHKGNHWITGQMTGTAKRIEVVGAPLWIGQAQVCADKLREEYGSADVGLVLCDENLLQPVLNILPPDIGQLNITMGYPLASAPMVQLVRSLHHLQKNMRVSKGEACFYYKDVLNCLNNPVITRFIPTSTLRHLASGIRKNNMVILKRGEILSMAEGSDTILDLLFRPADGRQEMVAYLINVLTWLRKAYYEISPMEISVMLADIIIAKIRVLDSLMQSLSIGDDDETFIRLLNQHLRTVKATFESQGFEPLQVMGFLETRTLDFRKLIILGANEGNLPAGSSRETYIPYSVRKAFDMPTFEHHDDIYAYHFYRLLQRAEDICLVYDNMGGSEKKEPSRFLQQLLAEYPEKQAEISVSQRMYRNSGIAPIERHQVRKSPEVMALLEKYKSGERQFSASSLTTYLRCPMQFYLQYIAGLSEDEVAEEVDSAMMGNILHSAMEHAYKPLLESGKVAKREDFTALTSSEMLEACLTQAFEENQLGEQYRILEGRNYLIKKVIQRVMVRIMENDALSAPFKIEGLEHTVESCPLVLSDGTTVHLKGILDRIDRLKDGRLRIVDYKSGKLRLNNPTFNKKMKPLEQYFKEYFQDDSHSHGFQGYFYAILAGHDPGLSDPLVGFYSARELQAGMVLLRNGEAVDQERLGYFRKNLGKLIEEILHPDIPFIQTEDGKAYDYSPFRNMLGL